jgi:hypothetical protein
VTLHPLGDAIWTASGPTVAVAGFGYPTRMIVIRLADGGLFLWSPVALSDALRAAVDALGPVRHLVAPNALHHRFIAEWQAAYPAATTYAPPGLRARRPDVAFDAELGDAPEPGWAEEVDQVIVRGNRIVAEVVFFHRPSRTVIVTDLIQHFDRGWFRGWRGWIARLDLLTAPEPTVPRKFRIAFTDRSAARAAVRRILDWPAERLVMAHGGPVEAGGRAALARAFAWLLPAGG